MAQPPSPNSQTRNNAILTDQRESKQVWMAHNRRSTTESTGSIGRPLLETWINTFDLPAMQKQQFLEKQTNYTATTLREKCEDN